MKCPKCGRKLMTVMFTVKYGSSKALACPNINCDYESKLEGEK